MAQLHGETTYLLERLRNGDDQARSKLLNHACERLRCLTSKMLKVDFPGVQRWEQTDDVLQNALIRLNRALSDVTPESPRHFWNLAALQIRRELLDLAHHYLGPQGQGAKHHTDGMGKAADDSGKPLQARADHTGEPASLEEWTRFHEQIEALPEEEREVFSLLWYDELTQEESATVLGISLRTVKRRWLSARRLLAKALHGEQPR